MLKIKTHGDCGVSGLHLEMLLRVGRTVLRNVKDWGLVMEKCDDDCMTEYRATRNKSGGITVDARAHNPGCKFYIDGGTL